MFNLFLTQGSGFFGVFEKPIGWIINWIYEFLSSFGIESVALSIIFLTLIVKTLMIPLTIRQQKFSKLSSLMNPEIMAVQEKYKDKKDEKSAQKQEAEMQAIYSKYGTNPSSGCLPMLVTLPIMMGLYRVIYKIPAYIQPIKDMYKVVANNISSLEGSAATLVEYGDKLGVKVSDFAEYASEGIITMDHTIDILSKFTAETWNQITSIDFPSIAETITPIIDDIIRVNSIPGGINMLERPGFAFPGILIPILAAALQFIQTRQIAPTGVDANNPTAASMNKIMPIMSGLICTSLPTGVGLYWVSNSLFTIIQQFFINKHFEKLDLEEELEKNKEKQKDKQKDIGINQGSSFESIAKASTKSIDSSNVYKTEYSDSKTKDNNYQADSSNKDNNTSYKSGNISDYANILNNRNTDKGEK